MHKGYQKALAPKVLRPVEVSAGRLLEETSEAQRSRIRTDYRGMVLGWNLEVRSKEAPVRQASTALAGKRFSIAATNSPWQTLLATYRLPSLGKRFLGPPTRGKWHRGGSSNCQFQGIVDTGIPE
jgi:hypothetical protein